MADTYNARRLILDGPIGVGKSTLLKKYVATFDPDLVSHAPFGARIIRPDGAPPILVLPEPIQRLVLRFLFLSPTLFASFCPLPFFRWEEQCLRFYNMRNAGHGDASFVLVELQIRIILALVERELFVLTFTLENPGARVVQERGLSSVHYFMEANKDCFPPNGYSTISNLMTYLEMVEVGSLMCMLSMPKENDEKLIEFVERRGDDISPDYLRTVAGLYRDAADDFDVVWDPLTDDVKQALVDCVESNLLE